MRAVGEIGRGEAPGSRAVGYRRTERGAALRNRDDGIGLSGTGDRRAGGNVIGCRAAGIRNQRHAHCGRGLVEREAQRCCPGIAGRVGLARGQRVRAVGEIGRGEAPGSRAAGRRHAERGAALLDCDQRVGLSGTLDRRVRGNLIGCRAARVQDQPYAHLGHQGGEPRQLKNIVGAVLELDLLDVRETRCALDADDRRHAISKTQTVVGVIAGEHGGVIAGTAVDPVVARSAVNRVVAVIA